MANKYTARKMFDKGVAAYVKFEMASHLMAMRLTDFGQKVPSAPEI